MPGATLVSAAFVLFMTAACAAEPPTEWKLLDAPLSSADATEFSVVAPRAGPHQVIMQFAWPIADQRQSRRPAHESLSPLNPSC